MRLTEGMRVYYAAEIDNPDPTGEEWTVPDKSDKSDTGTVKDGGLHHTGRRLLTVFWDTEPGECDDVQSDGKIVGGSGWALPLEAEQ